MPSERFEVLNGEFNNKRALVAAPPIAFHAAGKARAISVNINKPFPAPVALHLSDSS
jgi:hypothetical protein